MWQYIYMNSLKQKSFLPLMPPPNTTLYQLPLLWNIKSWRKFVVRFVWLDSALLFSLPLFTLHRSFHFIIFDLANPCWWYKTWLTMNGMSADVGWGVSIICGTGNFVVAANKFKLIYWFPDGLEYIIFWIIRVWRLK